MAKDYEEKTGLGKRIEAWTHGSTKKEYEQGREFFEDFAQDIEDTEDRRAREEEMRRKEAEEKARFKASLPTVTDMYSGPLASSTHSYHKTQRIPNTNGTGGGNPTFAQKDFNTMSAVADPSIKTAGSLFSKPVAPPMDDVQKSLQQRITSQT